MQTPNMEPGQTEPKVRFGKERWGGLIIWYAILNAVLFGGMILVGWYAWTSGIIPGSRS